MKFLGIDVGTGGSRAVLIDEKGKTVASSTVDHASFTSAKPGWAEQHPDDWWRASAGAIRSVLAAPSVRAEEVAAVGLTGQMHGSVFLGETGIVVRPALLWCDQRTEKQCVEVTATVGAERLIGLVSNPAVTGFTLPKILWLRENEPENWRRVRSILLPKDYIRYRLSSDKASDVSDSSGTLLFDVRNRRWSSEMLDIFSLDKKFFPEVYESIEITGTVSQKGAEETGLLPGTKIVAGAGDNAAGAIGTGTVHPGTVSVTIGTSGVAFVVTDRPTLDLKGRTHTLCHAVPGRWHMTGVTQSAGFSLKWFRQNFAADKSYDELTAEAAAVPSGANGLIWLPYLMGERTPHMDPDARAAFVGFNGVHTHAHAVRAILEGVAFSLRECLDIFRELKLPLDKIRLGGGGAESALWRQIQADIYGQSVELLKAEEGAAFGAAILAGVGAGRWETVDEACRQTIAVRETIEPNGANKKVLDKRYASYRALYPALRGL
jgi:xylulokinase